MLEEESMKQTLDIILPQILSEDTSFITIPHQGCGDLRISVENKLKSWRGDDMRFVIVHDKDNKDCRLLKQELAKICKPYNRKVLIRIACQELEAWYFGDLKAVSAAYGKNLSPLANKNKYRYPDNIRNPKELLRRLIPEHQQISGAKRIACHMDLSANSSASFNTFINGVRRLENTDNV
ncbi:hypothetical protein Cloev_0924 [Cloacibacillus evryensis DSM 19522]|nr:hypothetical protein Cloev_0924 [Cloacibacillus evryensis DSM 19522]